MKMARLSRLEIRGLFGFVYAFRWMPSSNQPFCSHKMADKGSRMTLEKNPRVNIDTLLKQAGWHVCNMAQASVLAARDAALPPKTGQLRIVAEVDSRFSLVRGVYHEVALNLKHVQALLRTTFGTAYCVEVSQK